MYKKSWTLGNINGKKNRNIPYGSVHTFNLITHRQKQVNFWIHGQPDL